MASGRVPPDEAVRAAAYGISHEAKAQGLNLHTYDVARLAFVGLVHVLSSGYMVAHADHVAALASAGEPAERWRRSWAAAVNERDRLACRMQRALAEMDDRALAAELAERCGLVLPPLEDS